MRKLYGGTGLGKSELSGSAPLDHVVVALAQTKKRTRENNLALLRSYNETAASVQTSLALAVLTEATREWSSHNEAAILGIVNFYHRFLPGIAASLCELHSLEEVRERASKRDVCR